MNAYEELAKDAVVEALQEMVFHEVNGEGLQYNVPWELVGEADSLVAYKQSATQHGGVTTARIFGRIRASMQDALGFFYSDTSSDFLKASQLWHHEAHDARVLAAIRTRDDQNPFAFYGIKYACFQPISSIPARDMVYVEFMGLARDAKGRDVGFHATIPLEPQHVPALGQTRRVPRIRIKNVLLVRALDGRPGQSTVFTTGTFDMRESGPNVSAFIKKYMENIRDLAVFMDSKRISGLDLLGKDHWVPDSLRKSCYVCTRGFNPTRHRHHCRMCGEVVCNKCLVRRAVAKSGASESQMQSFSQSQSRAAMAKLKICMFCVQKTRSNMTKPQASSTALSGSNSRASSLYETSICTNDHRHSFQTEGEVDIDNYDDCATVVAESCVTGLAVPSPTVRGSDMSCMTAVTERDPMGASFYADLYIDTKDMQRSAPYYQSGAMPPAPDTTAFQRNRFRASSNVSGSNSNSNSSTSSVGTMGPPPPYKPRSPSTPQYPHSTPSGRRMAPPQPMPMQRTQPFQRSVEQQLAEQQQLLRQMALAAKQHSGYRY